MRPILSSDKSAVSITATALTYGILTLTTADENTFLRIAKE
jgi:hypothetical protein